MIVNQGLFTVRDWIKDGTGNEPANIGVGLGTTAPDKDDTALTSEVYPTTSRNSCTRTKSSDVVIFYMNQATSEGSTATYAEHGLFNNSTTGTIFCIQTHPDTDKSDNINMESFIAVEVSSYLP